MNDVDIVLTGFGNVGRAFAGLLLEKAHLLEDRYRLRLRLRAIFNSTGGFIPRSPAAVGRLLREGTPRTGEPSPWDPKAKLTASFVRGARGALVVCTASDGRTGEPGLGQIRLALSRGWHVVTADKSPLAARYEELRRTAGRKRLALGFSAAAGAALPALDVGLGSLAGTEIASIEGILNGTTNYILTRMGQGAGFDDALREAQAMGIAEPDPSRDIEGRDTAVKLLLIANPTMGLDLGLDDIEVEAVTGVGPKAVRSAKRKGEALKYLGRIQRQAGRITAEVKVRAIAPSHPLFGVDGTNKGVTFQTDTMGAVTVTGGKSDPRGAAAALLKDIINIYRR
jgi:homoserine dehydrogenase